MTADEQLGGRTDSTVPTSERVNGHAGFEPMQGTNNFGAEQVSAGSDLEVEHPRNRAAVLILRGEHDLANRGALADQLSSLFAANDLVVVDLSVVSFIDSTILRVFIQAGHDARADNKVLRFQLGTAPIAKRIFDVTGLLDHLDCASTRAEALAC